jgi:hypothetical protein
LRRSPLLAAIETLTKQTLEREEEPGFEPDHRVPMTNAAGQLVKKPKKPKVPGGRSAKGVPGNWVGFDDAPAKSGRRGGGRSAPGKTAGPAKKPAAKARPR